MTKLVSKKTEYRIVGPIQDCVSLATPWCEHWHQAVDHHHDWPDAIPPHKCKVIKRVTIMYECTHPMPEALTCNCKHHE